MAKNSVSIKRRNSNDASSPTEDILPSTQKPENLEEQQSTTRNQSHEEPGERSSNIMKQNVTEALPEPTKCRGNNGSERKFSRDLDIQIDQSKSNCISSCGESNPTETENAAKSQDNDDSAEDKNSDDSQRQETNTPDFIETNNNANWQNRTDSEREDSDNQSRQDQSEEYRRIVENSRRMNHLELPKNINFSVVNYRQFRPAAYYPISHIGVVPFQDSVQPLIPMTEYCTQCLQPSHHFTLTNFGTSGMVPQVCLPNSPLLQHQAITTPQHVWNPDNSMHSDQTPHVPSGDSQRPSVLNKSSRETEREIVYMKNLVAKIKASSENVKATKSFKKDQIISAQLQDIEIEEIAKSKDEDVSNRIVIIGEEIFLCLSSYRALKFGSRQDYLENHGNYYFSENNLTKDEFLLKLLRDNSNMCPFEELIKFPRLRILSFTVSEVLEWALQSRDVEVIHDESGTPIGVKPLNIFQKPTESGNKDSASGSSEDSP